MGVGDCVWHTPSTPWPGWCRERCWLCRCGRACRGRRSSVVPRLPGRTLTCSGPCSTSCCSLSRAHLRQLSCRSSTWPRRAPLCSIRWARRPWQPPRSPHLPLQLPKFAKVSCPLMRLAALRYLWRLGKFATRQVHRCLNTDLAKPPERKRECQPEWGRTSTALGRRLQAKQQQYR